MPALLGMFGRTPNTFASAQQHLSPYIHTKSYRKRHTVRCAAQSGDAQRPLVVVGSVNADLVLQVSRLPDAGETMTADSLDTFPGGKVQHDVRRPQLACSDQHPLQPLTLGFCDVTY